MAEFVKVATRSELPPGGKTLAEIDGRAIAVFNVEGIFAIDDVCTHDGGPLAEGELLPGGQIRCPRRGARFDVRTGRALSMPAVEPVCTHRVELRGEDVCVALED